MIGRAFLAMALGAGAMPGLPGPAIVHINRRQAPGRRRFYGEMRPGREANGRTGAAARRLEAIRLSKTKARPWKRGRFI